MIEGFILDLQDYCKGCPAFEPEATCALSGKNGPVWHIRCRNRGRCAQLLRHLERKMSYKMASEESVNETQGEVAD